MQSNGFPKRWLNWIKIIFNSSISAICLMGFLGKCFTLFVLAVDFLQTIGNAARQQGLLSLPMDLLHVQDFPILQYADDTLIFLQEDSR